MTQQLIKLSVSKTSTFDSCRAKYKFIYINKLPRQEFSYHTFGRFVHRVLELFHEEYINGSNVGFSQTMSKCFKQSLNEKEFLNKLEPEAKKEAFEILDKYLKKITLEKLKTRVPEVLAVEKNFNIEINDNTKLTGMIDRIQKDPDGIIHVIDYKTTKNKKYLLDDSLQLLTYAYVLLREDPNLKKIRGSYVLLRHDFEYITKEFELEEILSIKDIYSSYGESIEHEQEFAPNPSWQCRFCEFAAAHCSEGNKFINGNFKSGAGSW